MDERRPFRSSAGAPSFCARRSAPTSRPSFAGSTTGRCWPSSGCARPWATPWRSAGSSGCSTAKAKDTYHFVICLREDGRPIGTIGLFDLSLLNGSAEFGISIGEKELWGHGLGTDAVEVLIDFGFGELRLERIELRVYDFNARARRSYEKVGFTLEGTERHAHVPGRASSSTTTSCRSCGTSGWHRTGRAAGSCRRRQGRIRACSSSVDPVPCPVPTRPSPAAPTPCQFPIATT